MEGTARCSCCFRAERRRDGEVLAVTMAGGARKPDVPADLAAWRALRRIADGELGPPVAICSACGQPMCRVDGELPPLPVWRIALGDGAIEVGPDGRPIGVDPDEADRRIEDHYRPVVEELAKPTPGQLGFGIVMFAVMLGIGAVVGACECPTFALGLTAGAVATAAERNKRRR